MAKYNWSEVFMSMEAEAKYSGTPTVYVRFTKCNFQCRGFNNPDNLDTTDVKVIGFDPKNYTSLVSMPPITRGCDSIYSWDEKFSHMWSEGDEQELAKAILDVLPNKSFVYPNGQRASLSLTGGEPTLRFKFWVPLLEKLVPYGLRHIIIETNAAVPLQPKAVQEFTGWCYDNAIQITWSISPKLSVSGEAREKAIRPEVVLAHTPVSKSDRYINAEQYFKFVCGDDEKDFEEVASVLAIYHEAGVDPLIPVYIMPMCCSEEQQREIMEGVANRCIALGYKYCHRIQNTVFENAVGK